MTKENFHALTIDESLKNLNCSKNGLTTKEVNKRLSIHGENILKEKKKTSKITIFLNQFKNFIVILLIIATIISLILGETLDATVILIVVIFNAIFGFIQEYKAEKAIEELRKLSNPVVIVIRDNKEIKIPSTQLVPGDIILLQTGDKISADSRLIESFSLQTQEASLTGESTPVTKKTDILEENTIVANRKNIVFSGTTIVNGRGKALVYATGMSTQIGKIAKLIDEVIDEPTPLQKKLKKLGEFLGIISLSICSIVFVLLLLTNMSIIDSLIIAVSLAVAAIPEGLPAVVTISLALGIQRMVKKNALIRKLPSVETLGCTTLIASDKTGTITKNEMMVEQIYTDKKLISVTGSGYNPFGSFIFNKKHFKSSSLDLLLKIGILCNDASLKFDKRYDIFGDPTEGSLIVSASKYGINKAKLDKLYPRIFEIPFDPSRKRMTKIGRTRNSKIACVKGAPDIIIKFCSYINENGKVRKLTPKDIDSIIAANEEMTNNALRVLGFAYKDFKNEYRESDLIFIGLQGMIDPPRSNVKNEIKKCQEASIQVKMITGDHKNTACAIAKQIGMGTKVITGEELDKIKDKDFDNIIINYDIFARVNPEHKIKIVSAFKNKGHIVAVTGDGVNDATALKKADIGVAMGITGTDVAKESSDMILLDDNFNSVVAAVEEGRGIYDNIQKFVNYLLSSNIAEVLIITIALAIGLLLPLVAIQLLWLNLVTDGLPALAIGVDPPEEGIMKRKPRNTKQGIITKNLLVTMLSMSLIITTTILLIFNYYIKNYPIKATTIAFTALVIFELARLLTIRSQYKLKFFSNIWLFLAIFTSFLLQIMVVYTPLNKYFDTVPLGSFDWLLILIGSLIIFVTGRLIAYITKISIDDTH